MYAKETSDKNLNLGKILLAIDNLYTRCNAEKVYKISKNPQAEEQEKEVKQQEKEDDEDNYTRKGQECVEKLKQIK